MSDPPRFHPDPDPTIQTIQVMQREISTLREILDTRIDGLVETIRAMQDTLDKVPAVRMEIIGHVDQLNQERFRGVDNQFKAVELRFVDFRQQMLDRLTASKAEIAIALEAADKGITGAMSAAERAAAKAELAADKKYLEAQIEALKQAFMAQMGAQRDASVSALAAANLAVSKQEVTTEKRFESVDVFRNALFEQLKQFVIKSENDFRFLAMNDKVETLTKSMDETRGRGAGRNDAWVYSIGALAALGAVVGIILAFNN